MRKLASSDGHGAGVPPQPRAPMPPRERDRQEAPAAREDGFAVGIVAAAIVALGIVSHGSRV
ncbi:MAG TPA: hypothetical protein VIL20_08345, partial [Sandaracinaceae bacterium]